MQLITMYPIIPNASTMVITAGESHATFLESSEISVCYRTELHNYAFIRLRVNSKLTDPLQKELSLVAFWPAEIKIILHICSV